MGNRKRDRVENKIYKMMLKDMDNMFGEEDAGFILSIILKAFKRLSTPEGREIRSIELKINNYFSTKFDFKKGDFVE